jgi:hypothetical protein
MARGKTHKRARKQTKTPKVMTIPGLRKSLEHITAYGDHVVRSEKSVKDAASKFASEWSKVFGKPLETSAAERYIRHIQTMKGKIGKKTRKVRGGGSLGAPIDSLTRPGVELPYGNFLPYVKAGFWNPEPAIQYPTGRDQSILMPYAETGSNKMSGGGLMDSISNGLSAISFRPFTSENPPSIQNDMMTAIRGQPLGPGGQSYERAYQYQLPPTPSVPVVANPVYTRALTNDVTQK